MSEEKSLELRVSVDVGYRRHSVAIGISSGEVLEEFGSKYQSPDLTPSHSSELQGDDEK